MKFFEPYLDAAGFSPGLRSFVMTELSSPKRHWHGLTHHAIMLREVSMTVSTTAMPLFFRATFLHDIVYDATRNDNEEMSEATAKFWLTKEDDLDAVCYLIDATKKHDLNVSRNVKAFLMADLCILWTANPRLYEFYARGIRQEYAHVSNEQYRVGRAAVLDKLYEGIRPHLLSRPHYNLGNNLRWETQELEKGSFDLVTSYV